MKLLYLTIKEFDNAMKDGVVKKIHYQIDCFQNSGMDVDYTYVLDSDKSVHFVTNGQDVIIGKYKILSGVFAKVIIYRYLCKFLNSYSYNATYIRFLGGRTDPWFINILRLLKKHNVNVIMEIPTYPYDDEGSKFETYIDRLFRGKLKKYVDRIVTYSTDIVIYGIKTIPIYNGIAVDSIVPIKRECGDDKINLIAVASFEVAHGYDRLIKSLATYYSKGGKEELVLHLVGDGIDRLLYEQLVDKYNLGNRVFFYGKQFGEQLDAIYNKADIAISSLCAFRKNIEVSSALKVREYLAKGLPIISGCYEDVLEKNAGDIYLRFPNDDSLIDIEKIVVWYKELLLKYDDKTVLDSVIREYAKQNVDISITMNAVVEYIYKLDDCES